jgi:hypothetical protein
MAPLFVVTSADTNIHDDDSSFENLLYLLIDVLDNLPIRTRQS